MSVSVPVVDVREMGVRMLDEFVQMRVAVPLPGRLGPVVGVRVMDFVDVHVLVRERSVRMGVDVPLA